MKQGDVAKFVKCPRKLSRCRGVLWGRPKNPRTEWLYAGEGVAEGAMGPGIDKWISLPAPSPSYQYINAWHH